MNEAAWSAGQISGRDLGLRRDRRQRQELQVKRLKQKRDREVLQRDQISEEICLEGGEKKRARRKAREKWRAGLESWAGKPTKQARHRLVVRNLLMLLRIPPELHPPHSRR
jgi:hypothetical protein